jgi:hypothetical protein
MHGESASRRGEGAVLCCWKLVRIGKLGKLFVLCYMFSYDYYELWERYRRCLAKTNEQVLNGELLRENTTAGFLNCKTNLRSSCSMRLCNSLVQFDHLIHSSTRDINLAHSLQGP